MPDFTGVTFANQTVTPADDALVRRALLGDGILTGCEFSYSGYTLTMRSGALIVCGRQIRHPSAQNWAVVGAKTGYARLVLDIDLTKSSTAQLFEQVTTSLEYASAEDGFTALTQENINVSGSHYQAALCVVSLGDAGITGIVDQMDAAEGSGGNFSVVGGLTQPTSPKENMIWVKADIKKSPKYVFAVAAPESPSDGLIWFLATNAGIITRTNVYTGGAWVMADTYMYLGGNWVTISTAYTYLFTSGKGSNYEITKYVDRRASIEIEKEKIAINSISGNEGYIGSVLNIGPFNATDLMTLCIDMEYLKAEPHYADFQASFGVSQTEWTNYNTHLVNNCVKFGANVFSRKTVSLDIQALSGELYFVWNGAGVANIFNIWAK